jgi:hypothetical protein
MFLKNLVNLERQLKELIVLVKIQGNIPKYLYTPFSIVSGVMVGLFEG